jgi:hypothetical protein
MQKTADLDVRPKLISDYRIKFKAEMLPLKDENDGLRMLYSHNVQLAARDWVSLSTTKTGAVYRLKGNPPQAHE